LSTEVALFVAFLNTVTAVSEATVGTASVRGGVVIGSSEVALFSSIKNTVTAQESTVGRTSRSAIALFTESRVNDTITAATESTGSTTGSVRSVGVICTHITFLIVRVVSNSITTEWNSAVGSASTGEEVVVQWSIITLLIWIANTITTERKRAVVSALLRSRVHVVVEGSVIALLPWISDTITTVQCALFGASDRCQSPVAFFVGVNDTITTTWETTIWSASIRLVCIEESVIALLSTINDTITDVWKTTLGTASVWLVVGVHWSIITLLEQGVLNETVSVSAEIITREVELELGEEARSHGSADVEENSNNSVRTISSGMPEIGFNIGMVSIDGVLRWNVEVDLVQIIGLSIISEVVSEVIVENNSEVTTSPSDLVGTVFVTSQHMVERRSISDEAGPCGVDVDW
jgi:hypothetical protein